MDVIVLIGTVVSLAGLAGLVYCIVAGLILRRAGLPDEVMRARLKRLVTLNLAALALSTLGLMTVVVGLIVG